MGAGKTAIGRMTAQALNLPFVDTDHEIETVSRMTIAELFAAYGEPEFRALEARVIKRLLNSGRGGLHRRRCLHQRTYAAGDQGAALSIWLKADLETLWSASPNATTAPC